MYSFNEIELVDELEKLPSRMRIAFAAAASTRQLINYERFSHQLGVEDALLPRRIATDLWVEIENGISDLSAWPAKLDEVMRLLPEESDDWGIGHALAEDALSSLAYAIRCLLTSESQEAAWAARRAYEAADQVAIRLLSLQPGLPNTERRIRSHFIVQRELVRQRNDRALLKIGDVESVLKNALGGQLLTDQEASVLR